MNIEDIKYPETPEEVMANRRRYIKGLRQFKNQCYGDLYTRDYDYDTGQSGKERRCAVGVAGTVFFGIKNARDLSNMQYTEFGDFTSFDIYKATARMLGIEDEHNENTFPSNGEGWPVTLSDVWVKNDRHRKSFKDIASWLETEWSLTK